MIPRAVRIDPYENTEVVDSVGCGVGSAGESRINRKESPLAIESTMRSSRAVPVGCDDLTLFVDPLKFGGVGARHIDRAELAIIIEKAMLSPRAFVIPPYDQAVDIDSRG